MHRLGVVPYTEGVELQRRLVEARRVPGTPDRLLLLQHPPVLTLGVNTRRSRDHIVASAERLTSLGVDVYETGRGGDVTYHGPGQVVGYPILDLAPDRRDVHRYVRDLEDVLIRTAASMGVEACRVDGLSGAWVGVEKLAAVGVKISRWVTSHGFAFNVSTDLRHFDLIVPCGIHERGVTSLSALLGKQVDTRHVEDCLARHFGDVFGANVVEGSGPALEARP